jgi:3-oxoacyl-[acyl-carrier-protein] synthase-3
MRILGVGSFLPPRIVTNDEAGALARMRPERIEQLFEVVERRWVRRGADPTPELTCSELGVRAARAALAAANLEVSAIDTLITVSITPDFMNPPLDYLIGAGLGLRGVATLDLRSPCAGLFRAVLAVEGMMAAGRCRTALIVTSETISPFFRFGATVPRDHRLGTALYADGAGALVVALDESSQRGVGTVFVETTGDVAPPGLVFRGMLGALPPTHDRFQELEYLGYQDFGTVLRRGSELFAHAGRVLCERSGTTVDDYKLVLTHQATGNMKGIAAKFGVPPEKLPTNIRKVGNTISASILILLDELVRAGEVTPGDRLALLAAESSSWSFAGMDLVWG